VFIGSRVFGVKVDAAEAAFANEIHGRVRNGIDTGRVNRPICIRCRGEKAIVSNP